MPSTIAHKIEEKIRTDDIQIPESIDFNGLLLSQPVLDGLNRAGFKRPSPIQLKAIPLGRCGLDLIVQAKSGTGKTCVFTVIALEGLNLKTDALQVLILAPTREIAIQINSVVSAVGSCLSELKCHSFIGGTSLQKDKVLTKDCHVATGTPGRIKQLIDLGMLQTKSIRLFVLDEADKLLDGGFTEAINWIYSSLPDNKQILALSATYPETLAQHLTRYMRNPTFVRLNITDPALLGIRQFHLIVPDHPLPNKVFDAKTEAVVKILSSVSFQQCLIFSNLQTSAQNLQSELQSRGWPTECIAGCFDQKDRSQAMEQLKAYKCRVLISTDLTSRGIDADKVNLVINLDVPKYHETYLHRIGRAGRFGSYGAAISIMSKGKEEKELWGVERKCKTHIPALPDPIPSDLVLKSVSVNLSDVVTTETLITSSDYKSIHNDELTRFRNCGDQDLNDTNDNNFSSRHSDLEIDNEKLCLSKGVRHGDMNERHCYQNDSHEMGESDMKQLHTQHERNLDGEAKSIDVNHTEFLDSSLPTYCDVIAVAKHFGKEKQELVASSEIRIHSQNFEMIKPDKLNLSKKKKKNMPLSSSSSLDSCIKWRKRKQPRSFELSSFLIGFNSTVTQSDASDEELDCDTVSSTAAGTVGSQYSSHIFGIKDGFKSDSHKEKGRSQQSMDGRRDQCHLSVDKREDEEGPVNIDKKAEEESHLSLGKEDGQGGYLSVDREEDRVFVVNKERGGQLSKGRKVKEESQFSVGGEEHEGGQLSVSEEEEKADRFSGGEEEAKLTVCRGEKEACHLSEGTEEKEEGRLSVDGGKKEKSELSIGDEEGKVGRISAHREDIEKGRISTDEAESRLSIGKEEKDESRLSICGEDKEDGSLSVGTEKKEECRLPVDREEKEESRLCVGRKEEVTAELSVCREQNEGSERKEKGELSVDKEEDKVSVYKEKDNENQLSKDVEGGKEKDLSSSDKGENVTMLPENKMFVPSDSQQAVCNSGTIYSSFFSNANDALKYFSDLSNDFDKFRQQSHEMNLKDISDCMKRNLSATTEPASKSPVSVIAESQHLAKFQEVKSKIKRMVEKVRKDRIENPEIVKEFFSEERNVQKSSGETKQKQAARKSKSSRKKANNNKGNSGLRGSDSSNWRDCEKSEGCRSKKIDEFNEGKMTDKGKSSFDDLLQEEMSRKLKTGNGNVTSIGANIETKLVKDNEEKSCFVSKIDDFDSRVQGNKTTLSAAIKGNVNDEVIKDDLHSSSGSQKDKLSWDNVCNNSSLKELPKPVNRQTGKQEPVEVYKRPCGGQDKECQMLDHIHQEMMRKRKQRKEKMAALKLDLKDKNMAISTQDSKKEKSFDIINEAKDLLPPTDGGQLGKTGSKVRGKKLIVESDEFEVTLSTNSNVSDIDSSDKKDVEKNVQSPKGDRVNELGKDLLRIDKAHSLKSKGIDYFNSGHAVTKLKSKYSQKPHLPKYGNIQSTNQPTNYFNCKRRMNNFEPLRKGYNIRQSTKAQANTTTTGNDNKIGSAKKSTKRVETQDKKLTSSTPSLSSTSSFLSSLSLTSSIGNKKDDYDEKYGYESQRSNLYRNQCNILSAESDLPMDGRSNQPHSYYKNPPFQPNSHGPYDHFPYSWHFNCNSNPYQQKQPSVPDSERWDRYYHPPPPHYYYDNYTRQPSYFPMVIPPHAYWCYCPYANMQQYPPQFYQRCNQCQHHISQRNNDRHVEDVSQMLAHCHKKYVKHMAKVMKRMMKKYEDDTYCVPRL